MHSSPSNDPAPIIRLIPGPLPADDNPPAPPGAGAWLTFEGIVRPIENDHPILALDYEAYLPMARSELDRLAAETIAEHSLLALHCLHSTGRVPVGACSFRLRVAAAHRAAALAAVASFIDRLKRDVPLWKTPVPPG